jgi:hypothetical protein
VVRKTTTPSKTNESKEIAIKRWKVSAKDQGRKEEICYSAGERWRRARDASNGGHGNL